MDNIDHGLEALLAGESPEKAIRFIEALLTTKAESLSMEAFDGVGRELLENKEGLLNRVMTRWFLGGNPALCRVIPYVMVHQDISHDLPLAVDPEELHPIDPDRILFLARKAIGYLFFRPVTAASIILSLVQHAEDDETRNQLTELLFDPLLINYPGKVEDYLKGHAESETESVQTACKESLALLDQYLDGLKSMGEIPELHPAQSQREDYHRHNSRRKSEIMRQAQEKSILNDIPKVILLYGRGSIDYVHESDDKTNRQETPLHSFRWSIETPRLSILAPFDLDYMLFVFRAEEIAT